MVSTVLLIAIILAVGTQVSDSVRVKQEEVILRKLPLADAHDYYELIKRRVRRIRLLRAITMASLVLALLAGRRRLLEPKPAAVVETARPGPPTNTAAAQAIAEAELARQGGRGVVDPRRLDLVGVTGDERHPWIFEYTPSGPDAGGAERVRIYVDRTGAAELHRVAR